MEQRGDGKPYRLTLAAPVQAVERAPAVAPPAVVPAVMPVPEPEEASEEARLDAMWINVLMEMDLENETTRTMSMMPAIPTPTKMDQGTQTMAGIWIELEETCDTLLLL